MTEVNELNECKLNSVLLEVNHLLVDTGRRMLNLS